MKRGFLHVLARSAELLERHAEELRAAHTIGSRWPKEDEHGAHRDFKELRAMAKALLAVFSAAAGYVAGARLSLR